MRRKAHDRKQRRRARRILDDSEVIDELISAIQSHVPEIDEIEVEQESVFTPNRGCFGNKATRAEVVLSMPTGWTGSISATVGSTSLNDVSATVRKSIEGEPTRLHTFSFESNELTHDSICLD